MNEIFINLIENAIRYNKRAICEITIGHTETRQFHQFFVRDNGVGIDKKYHDKIFKLFQTLEVDDEDPTAGIGLAIVQKIVNELGGKVWVESAEDEYFKICFTILKGEMG
jgi:light-regulated signal transduction histidine kinase (bacteriophytochrome)